MNQFISSDKQEIIKEGIKTGIRIDGRTLLDARELSILYNQQLNGVEISLGKTKVFGKITANITEPRPDKQNQGFVAIRVDLGLLSAQNTDSGYIRHLNDEIVKVIENSMKGSK